MDPWWQSLPPASEVSSAGESLSVRRLGRGSRFMVMLHGGPGLDHHLLLPLARPLADHFEVWLPDLPGHGRSQRGTARLPDLDGLLARTARWLAGLDPAPDVLFGHSLGAWLVREILRAGRVSPSRAVLLCPPVVPARERSGRRSISWKGVSEPKRDLRQELVAFCTEEAPRSGPSAGLLGVIDRAVLRPPQAFRELHDQLRQALAQPPSVSRACPVLLLCGERDRRCPPEAVRALAKATPKSRLRILEGLGHVPFASESGCARVVEAMLGFLRPPWSDAVPG